MAFIFLKCVQAIHFYNLLVLLPCVTLIRFHEENCIALNIGTWQSANQSALSLILTCHALKENGLYIDE